MADYLLKGGVMKRLPASIFVIALLFFFGSFSPYGAGFTSECSNGNCEVAARGSLHGIFAGLAIGVLVWLMPRKKTESWATEPVGVFRRLSAVYINMAVILFTLTNIVVLPILLVEAEYTGEFQWNFERDFSRDWDFLLTGAGVLFLFAAMFYHYYRSLIVGRPTIGQYLMGYRIVRNGGPWTRTTAMKRMGHTLLNLCAWPIAVFMALKNEKKAFWWDLKTDSLAERFAYADEEDAG